MNVNTLFEQFEKRRVLVVGDVMIDAYMRGSVQRVSPEAPVPIVNLNKSEDRLGGAANVALNLWSLGAEPVLCAVIGDDKGGELFFDLLKKRGMTSEGMIRDASRKTTVKTRVIGNNQHLIRIDEEEICDLDENLENQLIQRVEKLLKDGVDAIILEDYNKGVLTERVIRESIRLANEYNVPVTVDPKKDNFFAFQYATLFKPNLKELKEGIGVNFDIVKDKSQFEDAVRQLEERLENVMTLVTLSEHGVFVRSNKRNHYIPAHVRNIADVSGAGDTVIAVATLCLVAGMSAEEMADIANLAGGLVCEVSGVVPIDREVLKQEVLKLMTA